MAEVLERGPVRERGFAPQRVEQEIRPDGTMLLRDPEPLDPRASRRVVGVEADARAFLLIRPYLKESVRVWLDDPEDPTPYWVVSTRQPQVAPWSDW